MKLTDYELDLALFAGAAYLYNRKAANWVPIPQNAIPLAGGLDGRNLQNGFQARAYEYNGQIVISYCGTYFPGNGLTGEIAENGLSDNATASMRDWAANVSIGMGGLNQQLKEAAKFYLDVKRANPGKDIVFTGHSLGGGIASAMTAWFDRPATTFAEAPFEATASSPIASTAVALELARRGDADVDRSAFPAGSLNPQVAGDRISAESGAEIGG